MALPSPDPWRTADACDNGPHRDLVGDLSASVRKAGMHMGLYHSIFEFCKRRTRSLKTNCTRAHDINPNLDATALKLFNRDCG